MESTVTFVDCLSIHYLLVINIVADPSTPSARKIAMAEDSTITTFY